MNDTAARATETSEQAGQGNQWFAAVVAAIASAGHGLAAALIVVLIAFALSANSVGLDLVRQAHVVGVIAFAMAAALAAAGSARFVGRLGSDALVAAALFTMYLSIDNRPDLGDGSWRVLATDDTSELWLSSYLAHLLLRALYSRFDQIPLYAPVLGCLVALGMGTLLRSREPNASALGHFVARAVYIGMGVHIAFFRGFVEVTMPSLAVGLPALALVYRSLRSSERALPLAAAAGALLGLAACIHAQWSGVLPIVIVAAVAKAAHGHPIRAAAGEAAAALGAAAAVVAITGIVTIVLLGYEPVAGDARGGFDQKMMPLDFLSSDHRRFVGSALLLLLGLWVVPALVGVGLAASRRLPLTPTSVVSASLACQYLAFVVGFGFDLGLPRDGEIMLGMGLIAAPAVTTWVDSARTALPRAAALLFCVGAVIAQTLLLGGFFRV